ncbi:MAG TPA: hypothetical protein VFN54_08845 [Acidimicrobiales bacterium]|nr:hypothetical protein [Acidimicrobiales bacterium]
MVIVEELPNASPVETQLEELIMLVMRTRDPLDELVMGRWSRFDPIHGTWVTSSMTRQERGAIDLLAQSLRADLRFEHLDDPSDTVLDLLAYVSSDPTASHVDWFMATHAHQPTAWTFCLPVSHLKIEMPWDLFGVRLVPLNSAELPERLVTTLEVPVGSVLIASTMGSNRDRALDRVRAKANRALRLLRTALREDNGIIDKQLRFRLDGSFFTGAGLEGATAAADRAVVLGPIDTLTSLVEVQPLWSLGISASNDLERSVERTAEWLERAMLEVDPTVQCLFAFFGLEGLVGKGLGKNKGAGVAYRLMMLQHLATGGFPEPVQVALLYKVVRNSAVHDGATSVATMDEAWHLLWVTRLALNQTLQLAARESLDTGRKLAQLLEGHSDRARLHRWLDERYSGAQALAPFSALVKYAGARLS